MKDSQGQIWVSMGNGELQMYQPETQDFHSFGIPQNREREKWDFFQINMTEGQNGKIWLGGISKYVKEGMYPFIWQFDTGNRQFRSMEIDMRVGGSGYKEFVHGLEEDQEGNLWMLTH